MTYAIIGALVLGGVALVVIIVVLYGKSQKKVGKSGQQARQNVEHLEAKRRQREALERYRRGGGLPGAAKRGLPDDPPGDGG